jgi:UbiD family decarboxylase
VEPPDLSTLPVIKCWPDDGGRFLTLPLVVTRSPGTGLSNLGIYRMQVFDNASTGMHWQIQKGGGFHYHEAEALDQPLEVAAVLGGDPALLLSAMLPLPEAMEELIFAGILRGKPTKMVKARTLSMSVPANAEFVLEGVVHPGVRRTEGPFGDHFGHYSNEAPFPVFNLNAVTRRKDPVYPAAVVGKPPQEDRYMGDAVQEFLNPFVKLVRAEVQDLWAYFEAGFHNLLVVSVKTRYNKEPMKTALGLFGEGQLSLTKCIILVGPNVNPRDFGAVLREVARNFAPEKDFLLVPRAPLDTLDFTSYQMHLGSKMALDATPKEDPVTPATGVEGVDIKRLAPEVIESRLVDGTLLVVKVSSGGRQVMERLARADALSGVKMMAAVSEDVDLNDQTSLLWGIFTRFDPARDVFFPDMGMEGAAPVYRGPLAIDATFKPGYPAPLVMDPDIIERVDRRWDEYWT